MTRTKIKNRELLSITSKTCCSCGDSVSYGDKRVEFHSTHRQCHVQCPDCADVFVQMRLDEIVRDLKDGLNPDFHIKCPGNYHGLQRNRCGWKGDVSMFLHNRGIFRLPKVFQRLNLIHSVRENEHLFFCRNLDCDKVTLSASDRVECECGVTWCGRCMSSPFHADKSCLEHQLEEDTTESGKVMRKMVRDGDAKVCPRCTSLCVRVRDCDGKFVDCNKVFCGKCGVKWCWLCSESNIDYDHFTTSVSCRDRLWEGVRT